jgi:hypothetical protein
MAPAARRGGETGLGLGDDRHRLLEGVPMTDNRSKTCRGRAYPFPHRRDDSPAWMRVSGRV